MKLVLLGAPGAGKGTQGEVISQKYNIPTISTGNIIRAALKRGTEMGLKAKAYIDSGRLVPDEVVISIVKDRISQSDCEGGFILDGFPRSISQAEALETMGVHIHCVLSLEVADDVIIERMAGRRLCSKCGASYHIEHMKPKQENICDKCGAPLYIRSDDAAETVKSRLEVFHDQTEPLKAFYEEKGLLKCVSSEASVDETAALVFEALSEVKTV